MHAIKIAERHGGPPRVVRQSAPVVKNPHYKIPVMSGQKAEPLAAGQ
jgi:hypothetical protein